jgi:hypothetical protein
MEQNEYNYKFIPCGETTMSNVNMESSIYTGINLLPEFFKNGNNLRKTPHFLN